MAGNAVGGAQEASQAQKRREKKEKKQVPPATCSPTSASLPELFQQGQGQLPTWDFEARVHHVLCTTTQLCANVEAGSAVCLN